jgi:hypothetical protein
MKVEDRDASPAWEGSGSGSEHAGELVERGEARHEQLPGVKQDEDYVMQWSQTSEQDRAS